MMRHVLIAVCGRTPQIITETVWALRVDQEIPIQEIYALTTVKGREIARERLFTEGRFAQLLQEYHIPPEEVEFDEDHLLVFEDVDGAPLEDIRSSEDNQRARDEIYRLVAQWTQDNDVALHCSLAGGRKSMGFLLGSAVHFFGRPQDRLYHVLVSRPEIEGQDSSFYYPPPANRPVFVFNRNTGQQEVLKIGDRETCTDDVTVQLAEIPFCRLRDVVQFVAPGRYDEEALELTQQAINNYVETMRREYVQNVESLSEDAFPEILGTSNEIQVLKEHIRQYAPFEGAVLISGPTGSGKELVAQAIHKASKRSGSFISVNCGRLVGETLAESALFGHEKGAFTGAHQRHVGYFEQADGGTVFLDEINSLPSAVQPMLLRVMEEGKLQRMGGKQSVLIDVRFVAATNRNLKDQIDRGEFREDLYSRFPFLVNVPGLEERREDIPLLAQHFLKFFEQKEGKRLKGFTAAAFQTLQQYDWLRHVRELKNCIYRAVVRTPEGGLIDVNELDLFGGEGGAPPPTLQEQVRRFEAKIIRQTLASHNGSHRKAAEILGMHRTTLERKMNEYGIGV